MKTRRLSAAFGLCAGLVGILGVAPASGAVIIASDSFDYTAGALAGKNGGVGWGGAWTGASSSIASVAPVGAGDAPMSGSAARFAGNDAAAATRALASAQSGNVIVEFLFQFDAGSITNNDFLGLWFGSSTGPNIGLKANCGTGSACTADIFARTTGSAGAFSYNLTVGETVSVLGYLQKTGTSSVYNTFDLWVNPTAAEVASLTGYDVRFTGVSSISSFGTIGMRTVNLGSGDVLLLDNLRLSRVPEPGTLALLGLALCGLAAARRRHA